MYVLCLGCLKPLLFSVPSLRGNVSSDQQTSGSTHYKAVLWIWIIWLDPDPYREMEKGNKNDRKYKNIK